MNFFNNLFGKKAGSIALNKPAPFFSLPDENGTIVSLSEFKNKHDIMLCFIRGDFCPFCQIMLKTFQNERGKFIQKNVVMLSVSPGPVNVNHGIVKKFGLDYKLLCDDAQKVMQLYNCHDPSDTSAYPEGMPVPGTFLIDKTGILRFYSRADKAEEAFNPLAILKALETLS